MRRWSSREVFSIPRCGLPISIWQRGNDRLRGVASVFECTSKLDAERARVPRGDEMPGARLVNGRFFAIVNGDRTLQHRVNEALSTVTNAATKLAPTPVERRAIVAAVNKVQGMQLPVRSKQVVVSGIDARYASIRWSQGPPTGCDTQREGAACRGISPECSYPWVPAMGARDPHLRVARYSSLRRCVDRPEVHRRSCVVSARPMADRLRDREQSWNASEPESRALARLLCRLQRRPIPRVMRLPEHLPLEDAIAAAHLQLVTVSLRAGNAGLPVESRERELSRYDGRDEAERLIQKIVATRQAPDV